MRRPSARLHLLGARPLTRVEQHRFHPSHGPRNMCQVSPDYVTLLSSFGWLMLAAGGASMLTGQTYFRGLVAREEDPFGFWSAAIGYLVLGTLFLLGVAICPRG